MNSTAVTEILRKIDELPEADRRLLEEQLAQRAEAEWLREATSARELALRRPLESQ